jgi:hypothetical protein
MYMPRCFLKKQGVAKGEASRNTKISKEPKVQETMDNHYFWQHYTCNVKDLKDRK